MVNSSNLRDLIREQDFMDHVVDTATALLEHALRVPSPLGDARDTRHFRPDVEAIVIKVALGHPLERAAEERARGLRASAPNDQLLEDSVELLTTALVGAIRLAFAGMLAAPLQD